LIKQIYKYLNIWFYNFACFLDVCEVLSLTFGDTLKECGCSSSLQNCSDIIHDRDQK